MLGPLVEAADNADQPLRAQRHGPTGTQLPDEEHGSVPVQEWRRGRRGYLQEGDHRMVARAARILLTGLGTASTLLACATSTRVGPVGAATTSDSRPAAWADSVLATLSLRDKAAQMVWPWVLGDYTATD